MYQAPNADVPCLEEIRKISEDLNLCIRENEIKDYHDVVSSMLQNTYPTLEKYVEPTLPVKYPRTPGYRPEPEDNKYNAWYYKTDIQGAPEGPLKGYRVVIKDNLPVAGVPMMHGTRVVEGYVPDYDPTVITRTLDAGATIVGKAVCESMCSSGNSFTSNPLPVLNPHNPKYTSGGSTSGCAVLLHTNEADMAIGADQGGSLRIPASWTGVVGFKPTYGLVPYTGLPSLSPPYDVCGPMARTVKDCALLLQVLAGDDGGLDMRQRRVPDAEDIPKYSELLTGDVSGKKVGLVTEGFADCDEDVAVLVREVAYKLKAKGATVEDVSIPIHKDAEAIYIPGCSLGSYHAMIDAQGFHVGPPSYYPTSLIDNYHAYFKARNRDNSFTVKTVQLVGKYIHDNYGMHFYAKSQNLMRLVRQKYDEKLEDYDVIIMPTMKVKAPKLPVGNPTTKDLLHEALSMCYIGNTSPFCGTGHPAISINAGFLEGFPVGMMLIGKHMEDAKVLNMAYAYEQLLN